MLQTSQRHIGFIAVRVQKAFEISKEVKRDLMRTRSMVLINKFYNKYYEKFDTFKQTTLGFFENIQQYKTEFDSLLTNNFQLLNAN